MIFFCVDSFLLLIFVDVIHEARYDQNATLFHHWMAGDPASATTKYWNNFPENLDAFNETISPQAQFAEMGPSTGKRKFGQNNNG